MLPNLESVTISSDNFGVFSSNVVKMRCFKVARFIFGDGLAFKVSSSIKYKVNTRMQLLQSWRYLGSIQKQIVLSDRLTIVLSTFSLYFKHLNFPSRVILTLKCFPLPPLTHFLNMF